MAHCGSRRTSAGVSGGQVVGGSNPLAPITQGNEAARASVPAPLRLSPIRLAPPAHLGMSPPAIPGSPDRYPPRCPVFYAARISVKRSHCWLHHNRATFAMGLHVAWLTASRRCARGFARERRRPVLCLGTPRTGTGNRKPHRAHPDRSPHGRMDRCRHSGSNSAVRPFVSYSPTTYPPDRSPPANP